MTISVPSVTFWKYLTDLIRVNPVAAAQFTQESYDLLTTEDNADIDFLGAEEELESLLNAPLGTDTRGDGSGPATTFVLCDAARGEVIDIVTITGPGDRLGAAWDEFIERHELDPQNVNPELSVLESYGSVSIVEGK